MGVAFDAVLPVEVVLLGGCIGPGFVVGLTVVMPSSDGDVNGDGEEGVDGVGVHQTNVMVQP